MNDFPYGWHDFPTEPPAGEGVHVELQQNGWLALIAFAAGPRHVYAVPAVRRAVRVTITSGGVTTRDTEPPTRDDLDTVYDEMTSYLADAGVPAPPRNTEWRFALPEGVAERELFAAASSAVRHLEPFGPETAPLMPPVLRSKIVQLLG